MDLRQFLTSSRLLIVAGKGGVGKTTVACSLARLASEAGLSVALVETDGKRLPAGVPASVTVLPLTPGKALHDYLAGAGLSVIARGLVASGIADLVATTAPGIDDLLMLGKVKHMERLGEYDLVIVDGPAAGHALDMLRAPAQLRRAIVGGPVNSQANDVLAMLHDASRCRVMLVTTPASTPVTELIDTAHELSDSIGVALTPVVVNGVDSFDPPCSGDEILVSTSDHHLLRAAEFRLARLASHDRAIADLTNNLSQPHLEIPKSLVDPTADELVPDVAQLLRVAIESLDGTP